ncbi:MAG: Fe-S cluster assembly protein SufD [Spirulinaceae cyanobacterium RM2_2_10]|nr:Fe-S cluster assembly protein SufD [Spirulinaceae cyanobacterium SM2_1_0]NJO19229.1 Fe-S cluster assembly protein SufD [Spirulinaceae cyanobacterium RM2_2_10]
MTVKTSSEPLLAVTDADRPQVDYLKALLRYAEEQRSHVRSEVTGWLQELRQRSAYHAAQQRLPSRRDEDWRFTDLSALLALELQPARAMPLDLGAIAPWILPESQGCRLVVVNGRVDMLLSDLSALPAGVQVGSLADLPLELNSAAIEYVAARVGDREVFAALNAAGFPDIATIWAEPDAQIETPIHLLCLTAPTVPSFNQPRALIVAERGASLTVVEQFTGAVVACPDADTPHPYLLNSVTDCVVQENARLRHIRYQREAGNALHVGRTGVSQARASTYSGYALSLGAQLSRHNWEVEQGGEQTESQLYGLTAIRGSQTADTHSTMRLAYPYGDVDQLHKCIVDERAHAVFNGKVLVPQAAQMTNAAQLNRNLLLSDKARVNTKPELQITADNVKCTHGATVSQIEADELFYLQSRGIAADQARNLLLDAFAAEILEQVPIASLRGQLTQCIACRTDVQTAPTT